MAIGYDELEGSPTITMDRNGGSAVRTFKVDWDDIGAAILEVFPGAAFGFPFSASMPGFPWLRASGMDIGPWDSGNPRDAGGIARYPGGAKITVRYEPLPQIDLDPAQDDDGPGGEEGSDGGVEGVTFLEHQVSIGGEYLTFPNNGVRWDKSEASETVGSASDKRVQVFEDIQVGVVVPAIEHTLTWNYVRFPPWFGMRSCIGKANQTRIMGAPPETLLFLGASANRSYSTVGAPNWKLEYRFVEKCQNFPVAAGQEAHGWNHFLRPNTGRFERMKRKDGTPVYPLVEFRQLFGAI